LKTCYTTAALIVLCGYVPAWTDDGHAIYGTWKADFTKFTQSPPSQLTIHIEGDACELTGSVGTPPQKYRLGAASENGRPTMRRVDARTLETTGYTNGQPIGTTTYTVSENGQQLVHVFRGKPIDGDLTIVSRRVGGSPLNRLEGTWRADHFSRSKPLFAKLRAVDGGVEFEGYAGSGSTSYVATFDGKGVPDKTGTYTVTVERPDSKTLLVSRKAQSGLFVVSETWRVSENGLTLSLTSVAERQGVKLTNTLAFDRE
jgi:hypothetical protein